VRGNRRVTSRNAEATYEALDKYARDLTAEVRRGSTLTPTLALTLTLTLTLSRGARGAA
jgi:hypothetical protein